MSDWATSGGRLRVHIEIPIRSLPQLAEIIGIVATFPDARYEVTMEPVAEPGDASPGNGWPRDFPQAGA